MARENLVTANQFLVCTKFFTNTNTNVFFNLLSDPFTIMAKKVNQIRNSVVCVVARLVFVFSCTLTTGRCNSKEFRVLGPIFPDYVISCKYGLNEYSSHHKYILSTQH